MKVCVALLASVLFLVGGTSPMALGEPTAEELEFNRKKMAQWKQFPEQWAGLRRNAQLFQALPPERRGQILDIDRELHDKTSAAPNQLHGVMERYLGWLERLDEADRKKIKEAPDKAARLVIVKELREQEWIGAQPKALRDKLAALKGSERTAFMDKVRQEERQRQRSWTIAGPFLRELDKNPLPSKMAEFPREAQDYYEILRHRFAPEDKERLDKAEGQWPGYVRMLLELAEKYPPALMSAQGPKNFKDLPTDLQKKLKVTKGVKGDKIVDPKYQGKWPEFASAVAEHAYRKKITLPFELWPTNFASLSPPMQEFMKKKLEPTLTGAEVESLQNAQGKWPDYPNKIQELAKQRQWTPPWLVFPGALGRLAAN